MRNALRPIERKFFDRDTRVVARELIGMTLRVNGVGGVIVETEAYRGDPASHFVTRPKKGRIMGETFGHLYVYSIYGMHHCMNVTTERDHPGAVLLRAIRPEFDIETMRTRRPGRPDRELASGPAKLVVALGISPDDSGRPFDEVVEIRPGTEQLDVVTGPRVGISKAVDLPWRFMASGSPFVSRPRIGAG